MVKAPVRTTLSTENGGVGKSGSREPRLWLPTLDDFRTLTLEG
jgi:hypothetical protein